MVLARDLSAVAQWLGSILTHEEKNQKIYPTNVFFFFNFEIRNLNFFFFEILNLDFFF